ncbi:glycosyltransferase family 2 protein [Fervidobacterium thailandense]|uniref:Glycosyl transferase n=1 Tax=Fervidobacterium thailandense TaxID=1008305 RepID=A0A1E3G336_9BACT|nr:glycosyltransferase family 2 protein [Fervidobacterium thailandense]ODN30243.1 glycosyl transferase [Fervidobacterium thailandense]
MTGRDYTGFSSLPEPLVSVILPTYNEARTVERSLVSLLEGSYSNLEVLVVDGGSTDGTLDLVQAIASRYPGKVLILRNEKRYTPHALNIGIKNAKGKYIMIASAHAMYSENYIQECVRVLEEGRADVAGGVLEVHPRSESKKAKAIAAVLAHPFGVGGARYRLGAETEVYVDTVAYGIYRKEIFEHAGTFDERFIRNQDLEFNLRLKREGYRTMLVPRAKAYYLARDSYSALWRNNFENGRWVTKGAKYTKNAFSLRHLVPLFFVLYLVALCVLAPFLTAAKLTFHALFLSFPVLLYLSLVLYFSIVISLRNRNPLLLPYILAAFTVLHVSYGVGSVFGLMERAK